MGFQKLTTWLLALVIALLLASNAITIYFLLHFQAEKNTQTISQNVLPGNENNYLDKGTPLNEEIDEVEALTKDEKSVTDSFDKNALLARWHDSPIETSRPEIIQIISKLSQEYYNQKVYLTGTIESENYKNWNVLLYEGESLGKTFYRFIQDPNDNSKLILLEKKSDYLFDSLKSENLIIDENIYLSNLLPPDKIEIPDLGYSIKMYNDPFYSLLSDYSDLEEIFEYQPGKFVFRSKNSGCYVVAQADGLASEYYLDIPWIGSMADQNKNLSTVAPRVYNFTWLNGEKNSDEYIINSRGCSFGCYSYDYSITSKNELEIIGKAGDSSPIYEYSDKQNNNTLKDFYENRYYPGWDEISQKQKDKIAYSDFINTRPLLLWEDPFGKFIQFTKAIYISAVECGKPVIYLYPETAMDVQVQVAPTGGFTVTEPDYGQGWNVHAEPSGELYNYGDQKTYPYLFWEGIGLNYAEPSEGFVVKQTDVKTFLQEKLAQLGLVQKEYDEFIEFWEPRMRGRNYYFITFLPQSEFDKLAPLTVTPEPDSVIRVFMDFKGLDEPIEVAEQKIVTPERLGFTVVEWGGALR